MLIESHNDVPRKGWAEREGRQNSVRRSRSNLKAKNPWEVSVVVSRTQFRICQRRIVFPKFSDDCSITPTKADEDHSSDESDQNNQNSVMISKRFQILNEEEKNQSS